MLPQGNKPCANDHIAHTEEIDCFNQMKASAGPVASLEWEHF